MSGTQWSRLYFEWAHDLKIQTLSEADQRRHAMLLCLHTEGHHHSGDEDVAFYMRISLAQWLETKAVFMARGLLDETNHLVNWERRQFKSDHSVDRTRRHRDGGTASQDRHSDGVRPSQGRHKAVTVTPPETETETETEAEINIPPTPPAGGPEAETLAGKRCSGKKAGAAGDPVRGLITEAYHRLLPDLPRHQVWSGRDARHLERNRSLDPARAAPEFWIEKIFPQVAQSPFLSGRCPPKRGPAWRASLPWLLNPDNVAKILNGQYASNAENSTATGGGAVAEPRRAMSPKEYPHEIKPIGHKGPVEKR